MTSLSLDHLVIAVRDLECATESYRKLLGLSPSWRGRHPTYGTANVLFRLDNTYLELLAPAEAGESPWLRALHEHLDTRGEGLYAIALGTEDIDGAVASARERGVDVAYPAAGEGVDLDTGARREWANARIAPASTRGVHAFFIQHRSPPDALPIARPCADDGAHVLGVDHLVVASSDLANSLRLWQETFGLRLRRTVDWPGLEGPSSEGGRTLHFLRLAGTILELAGESAPDRPGARDLFWGVSYRVGDVAATVDRLRADGIEVSDIRSGRAPNTAVADLKPGFSHDVRTLFIERESA